MTTFMPVHPQVDTSIGVRVDAGIAALLEALWAAGLSTEFSCQGSGARGYAHIAFTSTEAAEVFFGSSAGLKLHGRWVDFHSTDIQHLTEIWGNRA